MQIWVITTNGSERCFDSEWQKPMLRDYIKITKAAGVFVRITNTAAEPLDELTLEVIKEEI